MVKVNFKQIDLLRRRRGSNNFSDPFFIDTNKYIKRGIISGLILILISFVFGIPFIFRTKLLENQKEKLKIPSEEYDSLVKKLDQESKQLKNIAEFNKDLKNSILNINSSSALFKEIALIIPQDIQLLELTTKGNSLLMKAKVYNGKYLGKLNSFLINLDKSEFIEFENIDLKEIKSINSKTKNGEYLFEMNTKVSTNYDQLNKNYLIELGSYGLFNRLNLLNNLEESSD